MHTVQLKFRTSTGIEVRIASLSCLVLLKVIAWNDRPRERPQDPVDIDSIIANYLDAGNFDRLYDEHSDLVDMDPYTIDRAGAALIGRDLRVLCSHTAVMEMGHILRRELSYLEGSVFFQQMAGFRKIDPFRGKIMLMLSQMG